MSIPTVDRSFDPASFTRALYCLMEVAKGESGQTRHVRRFLLGLYNGGAWPFDLTDLRCLDPELQQYCLEVLAVDMLGIREIHTWLPDTEPLFTAWWVQELPARDEWIRREAEEQPARDYWLASQVAHVRGRLEQGRVR